jgi:hypothetical protein
MLHSRHYQPAGRVQAAAARRVIDVARRARGAGQPGADCRAGEGGVSASLLPKCLGDRLPQRDLIGGVEHAELADDQALFDRGEHWLMAEGLSRPASCHSLTQTDPNAGAGRSWLVTAITTTSYLAVLQAMLLTTTAGRRFDAL